MNKNSKPPRNVVSEDTGYVLDVDNMSLKQLRDTVSTLIGKYGENAYFDVNMNDRHPSNNLRIIRQETDAEYEARIRAQNEFQQRAEQKDRAEYERLKKIFG